MLEIAVVSAFYFSQRFSRIIRYDLLLLNLCIVVYTVAVFSACGLGRMIPACVILKKLL